MIKVTCQRAIYLPRIEYFYRLSLADFSVIMDTVEMGRGSVENKGYIPSPDGKSKLSVPIINGGRRLVRDVRVMDKTGWRERHMNMLEDVYSEHPHYAEVKAWLFPLYLGRQRYLMDLNLDLIQGAMEYMGLECELRLASELAIQNTDVTECIVKATKLCGGEHYISSFRGKDYLKFETFIANGVKCTVHDFKHPVYKQFGNDDKFVTRLSITDLLFNYGGQAIDILRNSRKGVGK